MKGDMHKALYGEMMGHLIKKMQKKMCALEEEDESDDTEEASIPIVDEKDILSGRDPESFEEDDELADGMTSEEIQEKLKLKKPKLSGRGVAVIAMGKASKPGKFKKAY